MATTTATTTRISAVPGESIGEESSPLVILQKGSISQIDAKDQQHDSSTPSSSSSSVLTNLSASSPSSSLASIIASPPNSASIPSQQHQSDNVSISMLNPSQHSIEGVSEAATTMTMMMHQPDLQRVNASAQDDILQNQLGEVPSSSSDGGLDQPLMHCNESMVFEASDEIQTAACMLPSGTRLERSNSCSQAETHSFACNVNSDGIEHSAAAPSGPVEADAAATASGEGASSISGCSKTRLLSKKTSVSHDNIAAAVDSASPEKIVHPSLQGSHEQQQSADSADSAFVPSSSVSSGLQKEKKPSDQQQQQNKQQQQQQSSSTSRFFSSKLNTGSLWSLLSVGSTSSLNYTNDSDLSRNSDHEQMLQADTQMDQRLDNNSLSSSSSMSNFLSRVNSFKKQAQSSSSIFAPSNSTTLASSRANPATSNVNKDSAPSQVVKSMSNPLEAAAGRSGAPNSGARFRFNVKYIGSSMLHKNFTLPMLEWIARDIKRQTVKGAQNTSQRQITIPARDVVLEIQSYQLTAISCRDGHCVFMHPMHCVSKYAQLQHDPTCFSYLIRDTKESPYFCHVFQAKSAKKVHEIFSAIREATTSRSIQAAEVSSSPLVLTNSSSLLPSLSGTMPAASSGANKDQLVLANGNNTFENSYQFEVMFVKKVKLQCRRVPTSFVDDALETLKSYEVRKGCDSKVQMKGLGKRIINASVDERQEYDEPCQSPIGGVKQQAIKEEQQSRSCNQSPTKQQGHDKSSGELQCDLSGNQKDESKKQRHQSMECLMNLDFTIKSSKQGNAPSYANDFSPYNTITCTDLNERIAKIPVVSGSVSLDHETRQKLARQVRETIMATAATIKKGVYASGDKLDSSTTAKALDSLSCTATNSLSPADDASAELDDAPRDEQQQVDPSQPSAEETFTSIDDWIHEKRRSSADAGSSRQTELGKQKVESKLTTNFDLFRRASARQVVKNRTMLLLIGKDELCTISIDKHQMLFNKSFNSIVHCLQGNENKDHFGLICRDSGKINPNAESYAGFIFKCQSEKVVREIMSALRQVIYSSHHNYHGFNSPYNPLSAVLQDKSTTAIQSGSPPSVPSGSVSLAAKRGFFNGIELDEAARQTRLNSFQQLSTDSGISSTGFATPVGQQQPQQMLPTKNIVKSMFCDDCPLHWFHQLCRDIESLPADASKAIILRRMTSLPEKDQDELYSRFSDFLIDSIEEHNEILMSLLRLHCERRQSKHNHTAAHQSALAKSSALIRQTQSIVGGASGSMSRQSSITQQQAGIIKEPRSASLVGGSSSFRNTHQRSGSTSGSLTATNAAAELVADSTIGNLMRAKNSISVSIENMLKRRASLRSDEQGNDAVVTGSDATSPMRLATRSGSFRAQSRDSRSNETPSDLQRSQSTSDSRSQQQQQQISWRDSISRTINDDLATPIVGLFRRRSSTFSGNADDQTCADLKSSSECLDGGPRSPTLHQSPGSPQQIGGLKRACRSGASSPTPMLSSAFWKKSIFDKIRRPTEADLSSSGADQQDMTQEAPAAARKQRTSAEWRQLWRKAINEQITLLKMDKQNQKLKAQVSAVATATSTAGHQTAGEQQQQPDGDEQKIKLNYKDVTYGREVIQMWAKLLKQDPTVKVEFRAVERLVRRGVPKQLRGESWMFLMNQYQLRHGTTFQPAKDFQGDANQAYRSLLSQLSTQQHEIFVDIGRTFPSHPYYSQYLSLGQLSLFNLLKAYSLLDPEVGYCQGLSFVAGLLLLHVDSEDEAFELMRHLLFNLGLRKQYLPSMTALHLQLYQLTRLLRDHEYDLFIHFDNYDISPSLYAAPWFLTLFASQFRLGFVSRLLDLIFLIGIEAIFRVSLCLLKYHKKSILNCTSLESTMDLMKSGLEKIDDKNLAKIFDDSMSLDLRNKLIEFEIEYTFYCAEDKAKIVAGRLASVNKRPDRVASTAATATRTIQVRDQTQTDPQHQVECQPENSINDEKAISTDQQIINESTSQVAEATATIIIQHLLANNHLRSLRSNYSY